MLLIETAIQQGWELYCFELDTDKFIALYSAVNIETFTAGWIDKMLWTRQKKIIAFFCAFKCVSGRAVSVNMYCCELNTEIYIALCCAAISDSSAANSQ